LNAVYPVTQRVRPGDKPHNGRRQYPNYLMNKRGFAKKLLNNHMVMMAFWQCIDCIICFFNGDSF
jgi:hypothetical protein